jgi:hypothetical protein
MSMMASKFHAWAREISEPLAARLRRSNANPESVYFQRLTKALF